MDPFEINEFFEVAVQLKPNGILSRAAILPMAVSIIRNAFVNYLEPLSPLIDALLPLGSGSRSRAETIIRSCDPRLGDGWNID
jgi:ribonuclease HIII